MNYNNQFIFLGDVQNLRQKLNETPQGDLESVKASLDAIKEEGGSVEWGINDDNTFSYIVYCTAQMRNALIKYPDVLIMDTTYKTNNYLLPLTTVMAVNNNGNFSIMYHS